MSSLNPNAKSWTPNASAAVFVPGKGMVFPTAAAPPAQAEAPKPVEAAAAAPKKVLVLGGAPTPAPAPTPSVAAVTEQVKQISIEPKETKPEPKPAPKVEAKPEPKPEPKAEPKSEPVEDEEEEGEEEFEEGGDPRRHINLVFIGHVDAGKSTLCGHIMFKVGNLDERTLEKFEREAKAQNRESWKYAWAMDITETERAKGKTEECGMAVFDTKSKRFTILDAPGHKSFIPHMIGGASQADVGILVISARRGEFETGFEKGGQTREHAMLAKTVGVRQLIVAVTKMDDPTVEWSQDRFNEVIDKLSPYLKQVGFGPKETAWIPLSGLQGYNITDRVPKEVCPWFDGQSLLEYLDELKPPERMYDRPLRLPVNAKYKERGVMVIGKLEAGTIKSGEKLVLMPNRNQVVAEKIYIENTTIPRAEPGDNVRIKLQGVNEEEISAGFVLCRAIDLVPIVKRFKGRVIVMAHKSILTAGYSCVMHCHAVVQEVVFDKLESLVDKKGSKVLKLNPQFVRPGQACMADFTLENPVCMETYKNYQQLGRFMLRDEGITIGIGVVTDILETVN